ncbi:hypothetical protein SEA_JONJAMES_114 [Gordonia Phage JonJames]|nr:hypothetical protein SEA_JONJAMES_114 [Gordonia Phage JonJames]
MTPTLAEIASQIMNSKSFDGAKWHDIDTLDIIHILGVLSEHYHLLPKVEADESGDCIDDEWNRDAMERGRIERASAADVVEVVIERAIADHAYDRPQCQDSACIARNAAAALRDAAAGDP